MPMRRFPTLLALSVSVAPQSLQRDDRHSFISRIQPELTNARNFGQSAMKGGTNAASAPPVDEPQLADVREQRVVECLVSAIECLFYGPSVQINLSLSARCLRFRLSLVYAVTTGSLLTRRSPDGDIVFGKDKRTSLHVHDETIAIPDLAHHALPEPGLHQVTG